MERSAGILLAISSLPSKYGIGSFSKEAYRFVDWLRSAHQSYWQILPMGPTGYGDSPYQSFSTFAGNPYFIDLDALVDQRLLTDSECSEIDWGDDDRYVDYSKIYNGRYSLLRKAYERWKMTDSMEFPCSWMRTAIGYMIIHCSWRLRIHMVGFHGQSGHRI